MQIYWDGLAPFLSSMCWTCSSSHVLAPAGSISLNCSPVLHVQISFACCSNSLLQIIIWLNLISIPNYCVTVTFFWPLLFPLCLLPLKAPPPGEASIMLFILWCFWGKSLLYCLNITAPHHIKCELCYCKEAPLALPSNHSSQGTSLWTSLSIFLWYKQTLCFKAWRSSFWSLDDDIYVSLSAVSCLHLCWCLDWWCCRHGKLGGKVQLSIFLAGILLSSRVTFFRWPKPMWLMDKTLLSEF